MGFHVIVFNVDIDGNQFVVGKFLQNLSVVGIVFIFWTINNLKLVMKKAFSMNYKKSNFLI